MENSQIVFFIFSALILVTAGLVAFRPRPVESAMWLILNFFLTAGLYVLLGSHFVAVIQVLVYAGAIMVLFVFVILLLNLDPRELGTDSSVSWGSLILFVAFLSFILLSLHVTTPELLEKMPPIKAGSTFGTVEALSKTLLTDYIFGFEMAGVILLLAIMGVGLLAYRKINNPRIVNGSERP
ncbi:MAG: NADH-ubiquinone/plastoquinone oxidoreductase chain 6 [Bacteriovoracaceae bacterium]|nr:NADH-ubiquinone/plastoquinone oxidoreductase chain 6 [Bacteriovoracaceae bacterium]